MDKTKKRKFIDEVSELGVEKIPFLLLKTGTEKIRAFSGDFSNEEIMAIWRLFPIEGVGLYFGKQITDKKTGRKESRLSLDALHVLDGEVSKKVVFLDEKQEEQWFKGKDIESDFEYSEFVAVKSKQSDDFIGTGKITNDKKRLLSFLPKERRRKD